MREIFSVAADGASAGGETECEVWACLKCNGGDPFEIKRWKSSCKRVQQLVWEKGQSAVVLESVVMEEQPVYRDHTFERPTIYPINIV